MVKPATDFRREVVSTEDAAGIIILDGGEGIRVDREGPRIQPFLYGERVPPAPTLPFGRWKAAS